MKHYYTDKARHALREAQRVARDLQLNYVGSEHLLLGLLREDGCAAKRVLEGNGVSSSRNRPFRPWIGTDSLRGRRAS